MASLPLIPLTPSSHSSSKPTKSRRNIHFPKPSLVPQSPNLSYKSYFGNIFSLCKQGQLRDAFTLLSEMDPQILLTGPEVYGLLLQECVYGRDLSLGRQIHARIIKTGHLLAQNELIETKLLIFYAKCGAFDVSSSLFDSLKVKNEFSWAAILGLYCKLGFNEKSLMGFCEMVETGVSADNFVLPNVLKACAALELIRFGRGVHGYAVKMGFVGCVFVSSSLVDMYGKCAALDDARKVFDDMCEPNVVSWNSLIGSYVQNGLDDEAIWLFYDMRSEGVCPSTVTLLSYLSASANVRAIEEGKQGHAFAVLSGFELDNILGSSILNFYCKVGLIEDAELVFARMLDKDVVAWNLLISSYVQCDQVEKGLDMCSLMRLENMRFDSVTLASILVACAKTRNIALGKMGHSYCIRNNLHSDISIASGLVDMYAKFETIGDARKVFNSTTKKDLVLWNTMLSAYAEIGLIGEASKLFYQMQLEGVSPNVMSWNAVIAGYLRNAQVSEAKEMFSQMLAAGAVPNQVTLTTLFSGLIQNGMGNEALLMFQKMQEYGVRPNSTAIISITSACTGASSMLYGRAIHGYSLRHDLLWQIPIVTALADMYVKCGNADQATKVTPA